MFGSHADAQIEGRCRRVADNGHADGQPQASPVWFVIDNDDFVIYSRSGTPRVRNITANPRVSLNLDSNEGGDVLSIEGIARVVDGPPSTDDPAFQKKYGKRMKQIGYTPTTFAAGYPVVVRVTPKKWRTN